jgi:hypothetical protein
MPPLCIITPIISAIIMRWFVRYSSRAISMLSDARHGGNSCRLCGHFSGCLRFARQLSHTSLCFSTINSDSFVIGFLASSMAMHQLYEAGGDDTIMSTASNIVMIGITKCSSMSFLLNMASSHMVTSGPCPRKPCSAG